MALLTKGGFMGEWATITRPPSETPAYDVDADRVQLAWVLNEYFSGLASRRVCAAQRGFVPARMIDAHIVEHEGALVEVSQAAEGVLAAFLLGLATAFPILGHDWAFRVLAATGGAGALCRAVMALYIGIRTTMRFRGMPVGGRLVLASGIKQVCLLYGSLFALSLDPLVWRALVLPVFAGARLSAFEDDLAIVLRCLLRSLTELLVLLFVWGLAIGLMLKPAG